MDIYKVGFRYTLEHIATDGSIISTEVVDNLIPDEGRDYMLAAAMLAGSQFPTWYLGLYTEERIPVVGDDMASLLGDAVESVTYDGSVRLPLVTDALNDGLFSNASTPAEFDYLVSAETVRGGFITSSPTRGTTTGLLLSAVLFPSPKILEAGATLRVTAGLQLVNA